MECLGFPRGGASCAPYKPVLDIPRLKMEPQRYPRRTTDIQLAVVLASTPEGGIGNEGALPWEPLKEDMREFHKLTTTVVGNSKTATVSTSDESTLSSAPSLDPLGVLDVAPRRFNAIMCGRRTWESLPRRSRPLAGRLNIIVSATLFETRNSIPLSSGEDVRGPRPLHHCDHEDLFSSEQLSNPIVFRSFLDAVEFLQRQTYMDIDRCFVIGGARMYEECVQHPLCQRIYWTRVLKEFPHDTKLTQRFVQLCDDQFVWRKKSDTKTEHEVSYYTNQYDRRNDAEGQYLQLVTRVMRDGDLREDRTGTGTRALFGQQLRFDLSRGFPLMTTKRVFFRGVVEELLWMIRGSTDSNELSKVGVNIWDKNGSREFLDSRGLQHRRVGDLGPVYGFQWRHFNAKYVDCDTCYDGKGVDQLKQMIYTIRNNPKDRRILMSAWNPEDLDQMALPPCHMMCQMFVNMQRRTLSCSMYQRSCDLGLGVPFNIASYALLTHMVAHVCDLQVGELIINMGDTHVYLNHMDALTELVSREPRPFPTLRIRGRIYDIDNFCADSFVLEHYDPHPSVKMEMAV